MSDAIVVELEQTLLKTNLISELALKLIKQDPKIFFRGVWARLTGRIDDFEQFALDHVALEAEKLPYNELLSEFLLQQKERGAQLVLSSKHDHKSVKQIADYLSYFDGYVISKNGRGDNSKGTIDQLKGIIGHEKTFNYIGRKNGKNTFSTHARSGNTVSNQINSDAKNLEQTSYFTDNIRERGFFSSLIKELRIHQWVKNILLFVPLFLAHEWTDVEKISQGLIAFFSFSLTASSVYVINDLWDINSDREHPYKKNRPFASGDLGIWTGILVSPLLLISGIGGGLFFVSQGFSGILLLYWALTTSYTFYLKRKVLLDVLILAGLYTIRLYAGAIATEVVITEWLMGFSLFFFLSLALVKRYTELTESEFDDDELSDSRGYERDDLPLLMSVGVSSGLMSVLIFALYINSQNVVDLYGNHKVLWCIVPVLLYWIIRVWKIAKRGFMHDDPVVFAVKDRISIISGLLVVTIILLSTYI